MSFIGRLFGSKPQDKVPSVQEAIQKILETEELMNKRQDLLEKKIEEELNTARLNGKTNKRCMYIGYLI